MLNNLNRSLLNQKIVILGLGTSGMAAAKLALIHKAQVTVLDSGDSVDLRRQAEKLSILGARVFLNWKETQWNEEVHFFIASPGISHNSSLIELTKFHECPILGELEFGFFYTDCPVLAVSGTNGKTTTVDLIVHCLSNAGYKSIAAGNIGNALSNVAPRSRNLDFVVVEVSSFQLEHSKRFRPDGVVLLNVTEDHLDRHTTKSEYLSLKLRLLLQCQDKDKIIVQHELSDNSQVRLCCSENNLHPITFSSIIGNTQGNYYCTRNGRVFHKNSERNEFLFDNNELGFLGKKNL